MIVVVGAGAAGLAAAIFARSSNRDVLLLERTSDGGRKILISGGGRCNILPSSLHPERFVTHSPPHLMRGLLRSWPLRAQREFFEDEVGIPLALEEETGKLFPVSNRARDVRDGLLALARARGVEVQTQTTVTNVRPAGVPGLKWLIETSRGDIQASSVILATGGLSVPLTGSDGTGLGIARQLGHNMHPTYPALTPLTGSTPLLASLSGISLNVRIRAKWQGHTTESRGGFLFTHRGYSGPSVLDVSHVAVRSQMSSEVNLGNQLGGESRQVQPGIHLRADFPDSPPSSFRVQWTDRDAAAWTRDLMSTQGLVINLVARHMPERLAEVLCLEAGLPPGRRGPELRRQERTALVEALTTYALPWSGDEGYKKAEVTGGGVALTEVHPRTLESVHHPGLFLCGEMLDAFGPIGGYNFAWAWGTGRAAGLGAAAPPSP